MILVKDRKREIRQYWIKSYFLSCAASCLLPSNHAYCHPSTVCDVMKPQNPLPWQELQVTSSHTEGFYRIIWGVRKIEPKISVTLHRNYFSPCLYVPQRVWNTDPLPSISTDRDKFLAVSSISFHDVGGGRWRLGRGGDGGEFCRL